MILYSFDRDGTVETSKSEPGPIPISMIRALVEAGHEVWAHGNQKLVEEAGIPGMAKLARKFKKSGWEWTGDWNLIKERQAGALLRRERLRRLKRFLHNMDKYIVIDNADLRDMKSEGWIYLTPDEFINLHTKKAN